MIRKNNNIVGSSYTIRVDGNVGLNLLTVNDETFVGLERLGAFGRAYREDLKTLIKHGVNKVLSSVGKDNADYIKHSLAGGYIQYADSGTSVFIETYSPLIASVLSTLSGISLDDINLLKLATIAGHPNHVDNSSYTFDFEFMAENYLLKVDKLSNGTEFLCCPKFNLGFNYPKPTGWVGERFNLSFTVSNHSDRDQEFKVLIEMKEHGSSRVVLKKKNMVRPGSSLRYPLMLDFSNEGTKTFIARVIADGKMLAVTKSFVIHKPLSVSLNIAELLAGRTVFDVSNKTEKKLQTAIHFKRVKGEEYKQTLSLDAGAGKSVTLFEDLSSKNSGKCQIIPRLGRKEPLAKLNLLMNGDMTIFTDHEAITLANRHIVVRVDKATGIFSFMDTRDSRFVVFQLTEEIGPPFTEYEFNRFQFMPISYSAASLPSDIFPQKSDASPLKPRMLRNNGRFAVRYALPDCTGILVEKTISFMGVDGVEIQPKLINNSGREIDGRIAFRTCLKVTANSVIRTPIYENSSPAKSSQTEDPYYIEELLLRGRKLQENWTAFEFPEFNKCVGLVWHGNPEYDFFPLWFNKAPWLIYDVSLRNGQDALLPPHLIAFKDGTWEAIRSVYLQRAQNLRTPCQ